MYNHAPENYICPFCLLVRGEENERLLSSPADIFYQDEHITALIASHKWTDQGGNAILIPNRHFENLYDLPDDLGVHFFSVTRRVALEMKRAYGCEGISIRQHNEPAGNQDVWHFHLHVFPRYSGDNLYGSQRILASPEERAACAARLRAVLVGDRVA